MDGTFVEGQGQREREIRRGPHLAHRGTQRPGQPLSTPFRITLNAHPASRHKLRIGIPETGRRRDLACFAARTFAIAAVIQRRENLGGEFARLLQHGIRSLR